MDMKKVLKERNEALLSMDEQKIKNYMRKYGESESISDNDTIFWASVHMARIGITDIPEEEIEKSKQWLISHGLKKFV